MSIAKRERESLNTHIAMKLCELFSIVFLLFISKVQISEVKSINEVEK